MCLSMQRYIVYLGFPINPKLTPPWSWPFTLPGFIFATVYLRSPHFLVANHRIRLLAVEVATSRRNPFILLAFTKNSPKNCAAYRLDFYGNAI